MRSVAFVLLLALLPSIGDGEMAPRTEKEKTTGTVSPAFAQTLVEQWTSAVKTHAAGTVDPPLRTVASWPPEHVTLVVRLVGGRVSRLLEGRDQGRDFVHTQEVAELTGTLARGLSLHTDIAMAERNANARPGAGGAVILVDGRQSRFVQRSAHWPIARQIAAELSTRPAERPRVIEWYRATAALMQQWGDCDLLGPHLEGGQALFADDPVVAMYRG